VRKKIRKRKKKKMSELVNVVILKLLSVDGAQEHTLCIKNLGKRCKVNDVIVFKNEDSHDFCKYLILEKSKVHKMSLYTFNFINDISPFMYFSKNSKGDIIFYIDEDIQVSLNNELPTKRNEIRKETSLEKTPHFLKFKEMNEKEVRSENFYADEQEIKDILYELYKEIYK
jgi:hypothetical protein